jgi:beta-lactamase superfamily II metal-dependent hydrolase
LKESFEPVWMDLAYVPHHGCKNYTNVEFFKRIRARYYVFSGVEPCKDVFNALLEAKKTWENKDQGKIYNLIEKANFLKANYK